MKLQVNTRKSGESPQHNSRQSNPTKPIDCVHVSPYQYFSWPPFFTSPQCSEASALISLSQPVVSSSSHWGVHAASALPLIGAHPPSTGWQTLKSWTAFFILVHPLFYSSQTSPRCRNGSTAQYIPFTLLFPSPSRFMDHEPRQGIGVWTGKDNSGSFARLTGGSALHSANKAPPPNRNSWVNQPIRSAAPVPSHSRHHTR